MASSPSWKPRGILKSPLTNIFILYILESFAVQLLEVPTLQLFEQAICNRHFLLSGPQPLHHLPRLQNVDEKACKIVAVQDSLATVMGWKMSFDAIPVLLLAVYFGSLAEKRGRRPVLILSLVANILKLTWLAAVCSLWAFVPIQVAWISSAFLFIGGGERIFNSMIYALVADALGESQRTQHWHLLAAGPWVNRVLTPLAAAALMTQGIYMPFWVAFAILGVCILFICAMDEPAQAAAEDPQYVPIPNPAAPLSNGPQQPDEASDEDEGTSQSNVPKIRIEGEQIAPWVQVRTIIKSVNSLFKAPATRFCLFAFYIKKVAFTSENFMFQYASEKFGWKLRDTSWLRLAQASGAVTMNLIVLPLLKTALIEKLYQSHRLNINIIRTSLLVEVVSFFYAWKATSGLALAVAMIGCGLGEGLEPALQGFVTYLTGSRQNAQLFTTLATVDIIAELTGGPVTAQLMAIGRKPGHPSNGICFLASSIMFSVLMIWGIWIKGKGT